MKLLPQSGHTKIIATLSLWTSQDLSDNDRTLQVFRLKKPFNENEATWNMADNSTAWETPGASGASDREDAPIGSVLISASEASGTEKQIPLDPSKVQELVNGTLTNNGFLLQMETELNDRFDFKSSDNGPASQRPKLVIQYTLSDSTPVPTDTPAVTDTPAPSNTPTPTYVTSTSTPAPTATQETYTLTLQPDAANGADTYMLNAAATTNYGAATLMGVGEKNSAANNVARGLVRFDLSSIPANAVITSATLSLWTSQDLSDNDRTLQVFRLKKPFNENEATWNMADNSATWEIPGASGTSDREDAPIGSVLISASEALGTEKQVPLDPSTVQELVNGTLTNNGFLLQMETELNDRFDFKSSDNGPASQRPKLVIQYTLSDSTPVPTDTPAVTDTPAPSNTPTPTYVTSTSTPAPTATQETYTLTLQPDAANGADTYMLNAAPTTNYGATNLLGVGERNSLTNNTARGLIKFDLSSIPANAVITSATLSLWTSQDLSDNDRTLQVFRLKKPFNENEATWNMADNSAAWETPGASGASDREDAPIGSILVSASEASGTEKQVPLDPSKVQELVNGTLTNNGFLLQMETELNDRFDFKSSDNGPASQRPKLVIQYTLSGPTSTPTFTPTATVTPTSTVTETPAPSPTPTPLPAPVFVSASFTYDGDTPSGHRWKAGKIGFDHEHWLNHDLLRWRSLRSRRDEHRYTGKQVLFFRRTKNRHPARGRCEEKWRIVLPAL